MWVHLRRCKTRISESKIVLVVVQWRVPCWTYHSEPCTGMLQKAGPRGEPQAWLGKGRPSIELSGDLLTMVHSKELLSFGNNQFSDPRGKQIQKRAGQSTSPPSFFTGTSWACCCMLPFVSKHKEKSEAINLVYQYYSVWFFLGHFPFSFPIQTSFFSVSFLFHCK